VLETGEPEDLAGVDAFSASRRVVTPLLGFCSCLAGAMDPPMAGELIGREEELRLVLARLADLPAAAVLEGQEGIGKTSIWRAALAELEAGGVRVLSTRPAEIESQLSYAGLADLLDPVLDEALAALPSPQRFALEVALRRAEPEEGSPDQAAIAFAVLGALRAAAATGSLVVAVDDMQWLDHSSLFALEFAAGRLRRDEVGFLLTVRTRESEQLPLELRRRLGEERVRVVDVGPLSLGALHHLVQTRLAMALSRPTLQRVNETSGGNPFFTLELARALRERGAEVRAGEPLPVPSELLELLRGRLAGLPKGSAEPLLFAAAMAQPTVGLIAEALDADPRPGLQRSAGAELIELDGERIRFTHPLFASVVYSEPSEDRRQEIHRRLASIVKDPEERARHLALSTSRPDGPVASLLDEAARLARGRGAPQAAAELSELAVRLTPQAETEAAHRRRLDAGSAHFEAGDTARALALFSEAAESAAAGSQRAQALVRLARLHHYAGDQHVAADLFRRCLADERADASVLADAADGLANSLFFLREELPEALVHARSGARIAEEQGNRAALAVALGTQGMIEAVLGRAEAVPTLESAVALEDWTRDVPVPLARQPSFQLAFARLWMDDFERACHALEDIRDRAVASGDESSLPFVLTYLTLAEWLLGRWQEAMCAADEGEAVAPAESQGIGRAFVLSARALVSSCLGREEATRSDAEDALALAERGTMFAEMTGRWALALLELSLDNPAEAHRHLGPLVRRVELAGIDEPGSIRFVTDDVEALIALGDLDAATTELERFEASARRATRRSTLAVARRCRGLLALASGAADQAFAELGSALDELDRLPLPFERARTLLALGAAQRQARQRRVARQTLEEALAAFDELGASLWSERTRRELRRISGRAPSRGDLTPTERRVAELVAEGRTNKEVAAALFVATRSVEGTLSRVYTKLGVRSRTELARRLAGPQK
jgi:DNA-binding CsgD family transcriptional regulator